MVERGRPAASSGNSYHDVTVVMRLAEMAKDGSVIDVTPEAVADVDDIRVRYADGSRRFEQVKEHSPGRSWSVASLQSQGVLGAFIAQHHSTPGADLVLVTASDARELRGLSDRARSVVANHPQDDEGALADWRKRQSDDLAAFSSDLASKGGLTEIQALQFLAVVRVEDNQGRLDQRREQARVAWAPLATEPDKVLPVLEGFARQAAIERRSVRLAELARFLDSSGIVRIFPGWRIDIDPDAYVAALDQELERIDVAKLPPLDQIVMDGHAQEMDLQALPRLAVVSGGHGTGKSRLSIELAKTWIRAGRPGLHTRLAAWATGLVDMLLGELSVSVGRRVSQSELIGYLGSPASFLVLDSFDEIPLAQRDEALRQIDQLARQHPQLQIVVTTRPTTRSLSGQWAPLRLRPLTPEQISSVIGNAFWQLPAGVQALASSPLMLGLLRSLPEDRIRTASEDSVLSGYVGAVVSRQVQRGGHVADEVTGRHLAEEAALAWLSSDRVAIDGETLRQVSVTVAQGLAGRDGVRLDTTAIEQWLVESGLVVHDGSMWRPIHRTVFDHLAGRALQHGDPAAAIGRPELREAIARYVGGLDEIDEAACRVLDATVADVQLLSRCRRLASGELAWPFGPARFATDYVRISRELSAGPLRGAQVMPPRVHIAVDYGLRWISETELPDGGPDIVEVGGNPADEQHPARHRDPGGNVLGIRGAHFRGASIPIVAPHLAAFDRAVEILVARINDQTLPDEGPDITYERLCEYAAKLSDVLTAWGGVKEPLCRRDEFAHLTPHQLLARFKEMVNQCARGPVAEEALATMLFLYVPPTQSVVLMAGAEPGVQRPLEPSGGRSGLAIHGSPLLLLVAAAERFGFADLPLHPLGLRPASVDDPVLGYGDRAYLLKDQELLEYVRRHELAVMEAVGHLVENDMSGISHQLWTYSSRPWLVELIVENKSTNSQIDITVFHRRHVQAEVDEVNVVAGRPDDRTEWGWTAFTFYYDSVRKHAYHLLKDDVRRLVGGQSSLGRDDL